MNKPQPQSSENKSAKHTAVIYFHGMGDQRRYEEISRLLDSLKNYAKNVLEGKNGARETLTNITARLESPRGSRKKDVTYVRVIHRQEKDEGVKEYSSFRFYEVYWAPITSGGSPVHSVIRWLFRQVMTPFSTLKSPWQERQRLRRAALHTLWEKWGAKENKGYPERDLGKILREYKDFESWVVRKEKRKGTFPYFIKFLKRRSKQRPNTVKRLIKLAKHWRCFYILSEIKTGIVLVTLFLAMGLGLGAMMVIVFQGLKIVSGSSLMNILQEQGLQSWIKALDPTWNNVLTVIGLLGGLFGITKFLRNYMGDVQLWTTYQETDEKYEKREEILQRGTEMLTHVLKDKQCERIVVIGHSLGSAIAMDSLLQIGRYNRARNLENPLNDPLPLDRIEHFITLGSPIDKIHYFFESHQGKYYRYNRIVDQVRGDIGTVPFAKNRKPQIHWINFWDQGDIISGALETPTSRKYYNLRVDNVHVSNYAFPDPAASHSGYFKNRKVIGDIFRVIFSRSYSFQELEDSSVASKKGYDYESVFLGPGRFRKPAFFFQILMFFVPWLLLACVGFNFGNVSSSLTMITYIFSGSVVGFLLFSWLVSRLRKELDSF